MSNSLQRKIKLAKATKLTRWAPVWAVLKAFGKGKRSHPSSITAHRRHWRRTKLRIKPRITRRQHLG